MAAKTTKSTSKPATKTATKPAAKKAPAKKAPAKKPAAKAQPKAKPRPKADPVTVHNRTVRSDADVLEGHRCEVTAGEHKGLIGTFVSVTEYGSDGYPLWVVVRSLQPHGSAELVSVQYKDIRPVDPAQS